MNYDFVFRRRVEEEIGIRMDDDAAKAARIRELAGVGMQGDEVSDCLDARFDVMGALRGALVDIGQDLELFSGAKRVS
jgi:hypothetical protein